MKIIFFLPLILYLFSWKSLRADSLLSWGTIDSSKETSVDAFLANVESHTISLNAAKKYNVQLKMLKYNTVYIFKREVCLIFTYHCAVEYFSCSHSFDEGRTAPLLSNEYSSFTICILVSSSEDFFNRDIFFRTPPRHPRHP